MDGDEIYYADVLLPLHLPDTYTYRVPREMRDEVAVGMRVVVQFGQKRMYSALVRRLHTNAPSWRSKYILAVLDEHSIVTERQMAFWEWMAAYYMCYPGDVMAVALPAGLKLASESATLLVSQQRSPVTKLNKNEQQVVNMLTEHGTMRVDDISIALGIQKIMPLMRTMIEREVVVMDEELRERFVPRKSTYVRLAEDYATEEAQRRLFDELEAKKRTKQVELLMCFMTMSGFGKNPIPKRELPQGSSLQTLIKNGVLVTEERVESRLEHFDDSNLVPASSIVLNDEQQEAYNILNNEAYRETSLLYGVTSSGKTEVYVPAVRCSSCCPR